MTVIEEEEEEQTLIFSPAEEGEHSEEWIKIFSQEDEKEITATLKPTKEEEENNMEFVGL